ncbi:hypothetical protein PIB30_093492, partial [Stylosanthes scabra]|nr:hypothetical protein [Stylosanthes scabra]
IYSGIYQFKLTISRVQIKNIIMKLKNILMIVYVFFALGNHTYGETGDFECKEKLMMNNKCGGIIAGKLKCLQLFIETHKIDFGDAKCECLDHFDSYKSHCACSYTKCDKI